MSGVYKFETNFMAEITFIGCCELVKKLATSKSIQNLSLRGCKGAIIAKNTRKITQKKSISGRY